MAKRTNRVAWGLIWVLAVVVLGGVGLLGVRLRPYWVAKYRGENADLRRAFLVGASLAHANLDEADLRRANLAHANLSAATLCGVNLTGAKLTGAVLRGATLGFTQLRYVDLRRADLRGASIYNTTLAGADLRGADLQGAAIGCCYDWHLMDPRWFVGTRYDALTRWPAGFDPQWAGAILEKQTVKKRTTRTSWRLSAVLSRAAGMRVACTTRDRPTRPMPSPGVPPKQLGGRGGGFHPSRRASQRRLGLGDLGPCLLLAEAVVLYPLTAWTPLALRCPRQ